MQTLIAYAGPSKAGDTMECVLLGAAAECQSYEAVEGAVAMTNISACDPAAAKAFEASLVDLTAATGLPATVGGTTAKQLAGVAAVGSAAAYDLTMATAEECLAACALWIPECSHVTVGALVLVSDAAVLSPALTWPLPRRGL
jgi:hypothetical protein